jgi:hypothetical protein
MKQKNGVYLLDSDIEGSDDDDDDEVDEAEEDSEGSDLGKG